MRLFTLLVAISLTAAPIMRAPSIPGAVTDDQRRPAGRMVSGQYMVSLELTRAQWRPDGADGVVVNVPVFAPRGRAPSVPGPLLRVSAGTRVRVTLHNRLATPATVYGLHDHDGRSDSLVLAAGDSASVQFTARTPGTHMYFARTTRTPTVLSRGDDSQLVGAFVVDAPGARARDRVLVISSWDDTVPNPHNPYGPRQVYAINGRSWPNTERLSFTEGDTVRWRVVNASLHRHPMHLHGTHFRVTARGTHLADTGYTSAQRREVVTELMDAASTMSMEFVATRPGNWLFHCHTINHVDEALRLPGAGKDREHPAAHANHNDVTSVMAGLVMALSVTPSSTNRTRGPVATPASHRLRVVVTERASPVGGQPSWSYVLQRGAREPASDSLELPGSPLYLEQGVRTAITVVNRGRRATAVHWHGMELDSYYDGVAGWSGSGSRIAPMIAPGDSFVSYMTPPRAGTFMYHTHAHDLAQLTGGLYAPMVVLPRGTRPDTTDRLLVLADSVSETLRGTTPPSMINGRTVPLPLELTAGVTHRLRVVGIGAVSRRSIRLLRDSIPQPWRLVAKDAADLLPAQQRAGAFAMPLGAGETADLLITPQTVGDMLLEVQAFYGPPRTTRIPVRVRPPAP